MSLRGGWMLLSTLILGCAQEASNSSGSAAVDLLEQGSAEICMHEQVLIMLRRALLPPPAPEVSFGNNPEERRRSLAEAQRENRARSSMTLSLRAVTVDQIKREERSVICEGDAQFRMPSPIPPSPAVDTQHLRFEVRPSLSEPGEIILVGNFSAQAQRAMMFFQNIYE